MIRFTTLYTSESAQQFGRAIGHVSAIMPVDSGQLQVKLQVAFLFVIKSLQAIRFFVAIGRPLLLLLWPLLIQPNQEIDFQI